MVMGGDAFDQAEGLRRLLGQGGLRVVALTSAKPRVGQTSMATNLAQALANQGKSVLIIDEGIGTDSCATRMGMLHGPELAHVLKGQLPFSAVIHNCSDSIHILPAREGLRRITAMSPQQQQRLGEEIKSWSFKPDIVLMDLAADRAQLTLSAPAAADAVILTLTPEPSTITQSYALIKQLATRYGQCRVHLLVNKIKNDADAIAVCNNMADAAKRYLQIQLVSLKPIPLDEVVKRANKQSRTFVAQYPEAPASLALRQLAREVSNWPISSDARGHLDAFLHRLIMSSRLTETVVRA